MYVCRGQKGWVYAWGLDIGTGRREERTGQFYHKNTILQKQKGCSLPWRVRRSNEEVDNHSVTHVETLFHCPDGREHRVRQFPGNVQTGSVGVHSSPEDPDLKGLEDGG